MSHDENTLLSLSAFVKQHLTRMA